MADADPQAAPGDVLVLDGECGLCTHFALFLRPRLKDKASLSFLGQQTDEGVQLLASLSPKQQAMDTVVLFRGGRPWVRSAAVVRVASYLRWYWRVLAALLWLVPLPIRDLGYRIVARNRKRWWAPPDTCAF